MRLKIVDVIYCAYHISAGVDEMEEIVAQTIANGYEPYGPATIACGPTGQLTALQTMVKYGERDG